jgi:Cupin
MVGIIEQHALARGSCWAGLLDEPPVQLFAGDVVMFPHGDAHLVTSALGMRGNPEFSWFADARVDQLPMRLGATQACRAQHCTSVLQT